MASPAKLRDGTWGARVQGAVKVGDTITITTRSGKSWPAKVARVVWTGNGVALVTTSSLERKPRSDYRATRSGGMCEDAPCCGCCGPQGDGDYYGYQGDY